MASERRVGETWTERHPVENELSRCCMAGIFVESAFLQRQHGPEHLSGCLYCENCGQPTFPNSEPPPPPGEEGSSKVPEPTRVSWYDDSQGFGGWCEDEALRRFPEEEDFKRR